MAISSIAAAAIALGLLGGSGGAPVPAHVSPVAGAGTVNHVVLPDRRDGDWCWRIKDKNDRWWCFHHRFFNDNRRFCHFDDDFFGGDRFFGRDRFFDDDHRFFDFGRHW